MSHLELMRLMLDDPVLMQVSHGIQVITDHDERRQAIFINLEIQFWSMLWEFGDLKEGNLRSQAADVFQTDAGSRYWDTFGMRRPEFSNNTRRENRFEDILNEEYQRFKISAGPGQNNRTRDDNTKPLTPSTIIGLAIATVLGGAILRKMTRKSTTRSGSSRLATLGSRLPYE
jgi:hypothetical protein